jgi:hypothetical protein
MKTTSFKLAGGFGARFGKQSLRPNGKLRRGSLAVSRDLQRGLGASECIRVSTRRSNKRFAMLDFHRFLATARLQSDVPSLYGQLEDLRDQGKSALINRL